MTATNSNTATLPDTAYLPARISSGLANSDWTHPMARTAQLWRNSYRDPEPPFVPVRSLELA